MKTSPIIQHGMLSLCWRQIKNILNQNKSNIVDAVIATTAVANDCILITEDKKLYNKMKNFGYKVMNFAELQETITSLHDIN